jgi:hypothetical protein
MHFALVRSSNSASGTTAARTEALMCLHATTRKVHTGSEAAALNNFANRLLTCAAQKEHSAKILIT